jgi:hypothetical protein
LNSSRAHYARARGEERDGSTSGGPYVFNYRKNIITLKQKTKLNSDYTIKFVSINTSKQDVTWIYLDKVTSGPHGG